MHLKSLLAGIDFKRHGIFIVAVLAIVRFILVPLGNSVQERREVLGGTLETLRTKEMSLKRMLSSDTSVAPSSGTAEDRVLGSLYPQGSPSVVVQTDLLSSLIGTAGTLNLKVEGYEMPEVVKGKAITELPIVLRMRGSPKNFIAFIRETGDLSRLVDIKSLQASKQGNDYLYVVSLSAYRRDM